MKSEFLSNRELRIFRHQIDLPLVGIQGQEKLKKSKVLIVGAGGKGTFVMQNLVTTGLGTIGICDNHIVEENSIPRQTLYGNGDLGKQKAIISKQKLIENNPFTKIEVHNIYLSENNASAIISGYDVIVDTTNHFDAHRLIDATAFQLKIPVVLGMLYGGIIMISVFHSRNAHSLQEILSADPRLQESLLLPAGLPGEVILYSLTGCLLANEVLKVILDLPEVLDGKVLKFDLTAYRMVIDSL